MSPSHSATTPEPADVAANLETVRARIAAAARNAGRAPDAVTLIAVSKTHGADRIVPAIVAGQRAFGENRVQEALAKWPDLVASHSGLELHLIGPLQSNKVREAVALFDVIQTVDRTKLARAIAEECRRSGKTIGCMVQINTGEEPQKAGVLPAEADAFIESCRTDHRLNVTGLMCIPPVDEEPAPHFALLADMAARHGLAQLSMGMSGDYEIAVAFGATHVRVGTAIFGARESR